MEYDQEQKELQMIERYLECSNRNILEVGCGEGRISGLLALKARDYIAIDPDVHQIEQAKMAFPEVDFRIGNGEALDFPDASFDGILFTLSLHHQQSRIALKEASRVLAQNGKLVIVEPAAEGEFQQFFHLFDDETEALTEALQAITSSDFLLEAHELFSVIVTFHDEEELCCYPFNRPINQPDDRNRILDKLRQIQEPLTVEHPIHLHDMLHIFSLRKTDDP